MHSMSHLGKQRPGDEVLFLSVMPRYRLELRASYNSVPLLFQSRSTASYSGGPGFKSQPGGPSIQTKIS